MDTKENIVAKLIELLNDGKYDYYTESTCDCPYDDCKHGAYAYTDHTLTVGDFTFTRIEDSNYDLGSWDIPEELYEAENIEDLEEALEDVFNSTDWDCYWQDLDYSEWEDDEDEDWDDDEDEDFDDDTSDNVQAMK